MGTFQIYHPEGPQVVDTLFNQAARRMAVSPVYWLLSALEDFCLAHTARRRAMTGEEQLLSSTGVLASLSPYLFPDYCLRERKGANGRTEHIAPEPRMPVIQEKTWNTFFSESKKKKKKLSLTLEDNGLERRLWLDN